MIKEVIILTKSCKNGGYCVAGVDIKTGKLVRLVSTDKKSKCALHDENLKYKNKEMIKIFDLVEVEVIGNQKDFRQPENYTIDEQEYMRNKGVATKETISKYIQNSKYIFYNSEASIRQEDIDEDNRYSLIMIQVDELKLWRNKHKENRLTANFTYNGNEYRFIQITDINLNNQYYDLVSEKEPYKLKDAVLVMSLAPEWQGKRYKLVANIIEGVPKISKQVVMK